MPPVTCASVPATHGSRVASAWSIGSRSQRSLRNRIDLPAGPGRLRGVRARQPGTVPASGPPGARRPRAGRRARSALSSRDQVALRAICTAPLRSAPGDMRGHLVAQLPQQAERAPARAEPAGPGRCGRSRSHDPAGARSDRSVPSIAVPATVVRLTPNWTASSPRAVAGRRQRRPR